VFLARLFYLLPEILRMRSQDKTRAAERTRIGQRHRAHANVVAAILALLALPCGGAWARQTNPQQSHASRAAASSTHEVTDEIGRRVQVPQQATRIVSLAPNLTEIVFALGEGNHLAGDTDFCDYPAEALQKTHVGGTVNPNMEEIASLMPDLILATSINRRETVNALDRLGLPVYVTDPHSVEEMIMSVEHIGNAVGVEKTSKALSENLHARLADLDRRVSGSAQRRVLFAVWTEPLISVGRDTFIADALRRAGGRSVVDTATEWPHVSMEEIVKLQPEFVIFASAHTGDAQHDLETLRSRPGWRDLTAIQQGNIVVISDAVNRPAPRMVDAIEQLARALHPEAFASGASRSLSTITADHPEIESDMEEVCLCTH
jgi:iron complex transport system substrate-binding protein